MTLQQMVELCQLSHPKLGFTLASKLLNAAILRFKKDAYVKMEKSKYTLYGVSLDGSSSSSPVTITASDGTIIYAYKDETVDTVTILPSTSILFFERFVQRNNLGGLINVISTVIQQDGTVYLYDQYGYPLTSLPSDLYYLEVYYVKTPATLTALSDASDLGDDNDEAVCDWVCGSLYPTRSDLDAISRMQLEKHHKNRYEVQKTKALKYYRQNRSLIPVSGVVDTPFSN